MHKEKIRLSAIFVLTIGLLSNCVGWDQREDSRQRVSKVDSSQLSSAREEALDFESPAADPRELPAFFDDYFAQKLPSFNVPGAVIAVVKDGEILYTKGYGYADVDAQIPYSPDDTIFWAASISKIFSVLGILQLNEQGLIDLDEGVNLYLQDFQIPAAYPQPITFRHLLTHTDGFEARIIGDAARSAAVLQPLRTVVKENLPSRIAPPGAFITYGNYGINLAGLLIEELSGVPFSKYTDQNIFQPLDMHRTSFEQSMPPEWAADLAVGYGNGAHGFEAKPYVYFESLPQGGGRGTAIDMAHLMLALLDGGRYGDTRILEKDSNQLLFQQQFSANPNLGGITCGLFESFHNGQRLFIRDGDGWGFRSRMVLIPDQNLGIFLNYNNEDADILREDLINTFMDWFYPKSTVHPASTIVDPPVGAQEFSGLYRPVQADESSFFKIALLFAQQIRVREAGGGILAIEPVGMGDNYGGFEGISRWEEIHPLYFQRINAAGDLAFGKDENGEISYLFSGQKYHGTYRKILWYETPALHFTILGISTLAFLATLICWPVTAWVKRRRDRSSPNTITHRAGWLAGIVCALYLIFIIGLSAVMANFVDIIYGVPPLLRNLLFLPILGAVMVPGLLFYTVKLWKDESASGFSRLCYSTLVLITLAFNRWLHHWNLLGFHF